MKVLDWLRLAAALLLAAATSYGLLHAGFGAVGAWMLGALFSTLLFAFGGGPHRVGFTVIAVLPPFLANRVCELGSDWTIYRHTRSPSETLHDMLPESLGITLLAFGLFVVLPVGIVGTVSYMAGRRKSPRGSDS